MIKDWHIKFKAQLATLDSNSFVRVAPEVVDIFLNKSINNIIQDAYKEYEKTQLISDYLSSQIINKNLEYSLIEDGVYTVNLDEDYYFHLNSYCLAKYKNYSGKVKNKKSTLDEEVNIEQSAYKNPNGIEFPIFFKENKIYVYTDKFQITKFNISYLKKPIQVSYKNNISSDIHEGLHEKIIQDAVLLALETYSSQRVQTKNNLNNV